VTALGGDLEALADLGLEARPDRMPGDGPLTATIQALEEAEEEVVLILSCDLLAPSPAAIDAVRAALVADPDAVAAVPDVGGHLQWTHAAWRSRAAPLLRARHGDGVRSLRRAAADLAIVEVAGIPPGAVADADLPSDLA
jgi:molybdopterin-guanine dinucleotide biosynthesis protein A